MHLISILSLLFIKLAALHLHQHTTRPLLYHPLPIGTENKLHYQSICAALTEQSERDTDSAKRKGYSISPDDVAEFVLHVSTIDYKHTKSQAAYKKISCLSLHHCLFIYTVQCTFHNTLHIRTLC